MILHWTFDWNHIADYSEKQDISQARYLFIMSPSLNQKQTMTYKAHNKTTEGEHLREQGKAIREGDVARRGETEIERRGKKEGGY